LADNTNALTFHLFPWLFHFSSAHKRDVRTVGPNLGSGFAVVSEAQNVFPFWKVPWHLDHIPHSGLPVITGRRWKGIPDAIAAPAAVTAWSSWTWEACTLGAVPRSGTADALLPLQAAAVVVGRPVIVIGTADASRPQNRGREWEHGPGGSCWGSALVDEGTVDRDDRVAEYQGLLILYKVEGVLLEARLCQRLGCRAEAVRVSSPVVVANLPSHLSLEAKCPDDASIQHRKIGPLHTMMGERGVHIATLLWGIPTPRGSACQAASISHWSKPGGTPRVPSVDVVFGASHRITIHSAQLGVVKGGVHTGSADVDLYSTADVIALRTANTTSL